MDVLKNKPTLIQLQYLVWVCVILISFFSMLSADGVRHSAIYALVGTCYYALIIYGNISFLYPRLYQKKQYVWYIVSAVLLLAVTGFGKGYLNQYINNNYFNEAIKPLDVKAHFTFFISGITVFVLSFVFRLAIAYFGMKQKAEEILLQRSQFELNQLKAQVQPHFLFNTLNNIYYEAYKEAPRTALLIERLSDMMRYFIDESTGDTVLLSTEVNFIDNYIALERIRIRHETIIDFTKEFDAGLHVPPMLLMTFIENIFKHGIDKLNEHNIIEIALVQKDGYLSFSTKNTVHNTVMQGKPTGLGIKNLRKRLEILYGANFELSTANNGTFFTAILKVPIA